MAEERFAVKGWCHHNTHANLHCPLGVKITVYLFKTADPDMDFTGVKIETNKKRTPRTDDALSISFSHIFFYFLYTSLLYSIISNY